jgi:hypothetical protein
MDDPSGDAAFLLGTIEERGRHWASAAGLYQTGFDKDPTNSARAYRLGAALDRLGKSDASAAARAAGLAADLGLPFEGRAVLDRTARELGLAAMAFTARMEVGRFVADNLDEIRTRAAQRLERPTATSLRMPIFIYWGQGFQAAPAVVRQCLAALRLNNPGADIHELTDAALPYYVDLPEAVLAAVGDNRTHLSDLIRLALLERYGGVWVDATCFVSEPLAPRVGRLLDDADTFAFTYSTPMISSWFLASRPDSYLIHLWRAAMFMWWEVRSELVGYYLLHHFFEMLYELDDRYRADWDKGTRLGSRPPHALQATMLADYDALTYQGILDESFVHKLSYKTRSSTVLSPDSYLAHFVRGDLPLSRGPSPGA